MKYVFILVAIFLSGLDTHAQHNWPVIKARSKSVSIRDGIHFKKDFWYMTPETKLGFYYVEIPVKDQVVSFITDTDSISFNTKFGEEYDFIILLSNGDSCHRRVIAKYPKPVFYTSNHPVVSDTIPFTIGNNDKIYFKGSVNNSEALDIQFDLGAGGCIIKKSSVKKVNMSFDGSVTLHNSDGVNNVPYSSSNTLKIANIKWDSTSFAVADNMTSREDMIAGNSLFQNKIVEINYDKRIVIIHDSLPMMDGEYTRHDIFLDGGAVPFIQATVTINGKAKTGWFMFDTGAYTTILQTNDAGKAHKIMNEAKKMIGMSSDIPWLSIGDHSFSKFNYTIQKPGNGSATIGLLGNDLLKRFNVILDNRNGAIYLKPNSLVKTKYANPEYWLVRIAVIVLVLPSLLILFIGYRKRRSRRLKTHSHENRNETT